MDGPVGLLIAVVFLYSFGHWIGASILLVVLLYGLWQHIDDPTGFRRLVERLRS